MAPSTSARVPSTTGSVERLRGLTRPIGDSHLTRDPAGCGGGSFGITIRLSSAGCPECTKDGKGMVGARFMRVGAATLTVILATTTASLAGSSVASGSQPRVHRLKGLIVVEGRVTVPAKGQASANATCPEGDYVVGGGGYQVTQNTKEDLNYSVPDDSNWIVDFNNQASSSDTGVAVAICVAGSSLVDYSDTFGAPVIVPAHSTEQATVKCPAGTVALGGGWYNTGGNVTDSDGASAPLGTNGWRAFPSSANSHAATGQAAVVCAAKPEHWAQVSSSYVANPSNTATSVSVNCPKQTEVLGGGDFNTSISPLVNIGVTISFSDLKGWTTIENNDSSSSESVDAWAVCAEA
jgi:hypothetical protein